MGRPPKPEYVPTPEEILEKCAGFREKWTAAWRRKNTHYGPVAWSVPEVGREFEEAIRERIGA